MGHKQIIDSCRNILNCDSTFFHISIRSLHCRYFDYKTTKLVLSTSQNIVTVNVKWEKEQG